MENSMMGGCILKNDQERYINPQQVTLMDYPPTSYMNPRSTTGVTYPTNMPYSLQNWGYEQPQYIRTGPVQNPMIQYGIPYSAVRQSPMPYYGQSVMPVPFNPINSVSRIPTNVMPEYPHIAPEGRSDGGLPVEPIVSHNMGHVKEDEAKKLNLQMMSAEGCELDVVIFKRTQKTYQQVIGDEIKQIVGKLYSDFVGGNHTEKGKDTSEFSNQKHLKRGRGAPVKNKTTKSPAKKSSSRGRRKKEEENQEKENERCVPNARFFHGGNGRSSYNALKMSYKTGRVDPMGKHQCLRSCERNPNVRRIVALDVDDLEEVVGEEEEEEEDEDEDHPEVSLNVLDGMKSPEVSGENFVHRAEMENDIKELERGASSMQSSLVKRFSRYEEASQESSLDIVG